MCLKFISWWLEVRMRWIGVSLFRKNQLITFSLCSNLNVFQTLHIFWSPRTHFFRFRPCSHWTAKGKVNTLKRRRKRWLSSRRGFKGKGIKRRWSSAQSRSHVCHLQTKTPAAIPFSTYFLHDNTKPSPGPHFRSIASSTNSPSLSSETMRLDEHD